MRANGAMATEQTVDANLAQLREVLAASGLQGGLALLNQRVSHRFTAFYRLQDARLSNREIVDKQGAVVPHELLSVPFEHSFCQFVLRDGSFVTAQSGEDTRLAGHPYQGVLLSYVGLPLASEKDGLVGTLCHFDLDAHAVQDADYAFLQRAAPCISPYL